MPMGVYVRQSRSLAERFWPKVAKADVGCWDWLASTNWDGYGYIRNPSGSDRAHVVAYELMVGPVPEGLHLDHLCCNRGCVRPDHLEPVTHQENVHRGRVGAVNRARGLAQTHCKYGHPFNEVNTYARKDREGSRMCRACDRERHRRKREEA